MTDNHFNLQALAAEAENEVRLDLGVDGVGLAQMTEEGSAGAPLTAAVIAEMFPADGAETPYRLAGEK